MIGLTNYIDGKMPLKVGLVGTGYAAKLRAQTLQSDPRSDLVAIAGHTPEKTQEFAQTYQALALDSWQELVERPDLDLVVICTINRDHAAIARAALTAGKHVVVEYPLALEPKAAEEAIALAQAQGKLLHVEHIELLGGVHQALRQSIREIGTPFYARYCTINPQHPAPRKWTYNPVLFGFPLSAALSRLHRLVDLFGEVVSASTQARFWQEDPEFYSACLCTTRLRFSSGLIGEVIYGKGKTFFQAERKFEVQGEQGTLIFDGEEGKLVRGETTAPIEVGSRRGLFAKDTKMVLDYLLEGTPLYITPAESLYTLKVADAARESAETGQTVYLKN
jgi:biliverdin reductase